MPEFRLFLFFNWIKGRILFHLHYKSNLSRITEVTDRQSTDLLYKWVSSQLKLILAFVYKHFKFKWSELHDTTDAQFIGPLALVEVAQNVFHICLGLSV